MVNRAICVGIAIVAALNVLGQAADAQKRCLLFVGGKPDWKLAQLLKEQGFEMEAGSVSSLSADTLRRYHAVVMLSVPFAETDFTISEPVRKGFDLLRDYVRDGGGLWINQWHGQIMRDLPCLDYVSKPFGLRWPMQHLSDPGTSRPGGFRTRPYAFTDQVAKSPVSKGVRQIWYPVHNNYQSEISTLALELSGDWTAVVKTGKGSQASPVDMKKFGLDHLALHEERKGPLPIFAIRSYGKGRLAACGIEPVYHLYAGNALPLGRILMSNGLEGKPSDMERLIVNTLGWLAEAGQAAGFGSEVKTPDSWLRSPFYMPKVEPLHADLTFGDYPKQFKGVIGARTTYSVGKATTKQWVDAARKAGLDFIIFTDDYEKISDEDFEKLRRECKELSDESFAAVPGVILRDMYGDYFLACGYDLSLPNEEERNTRMRRLGRPNNKPGEQMGMQLLRWAYTRQGFHVGLGSCLHKQSAIPYYDYRDYWMMAVVTQLHGKIVDEVLQPYFHLINRGETLTPVGLALMDEPGELKGIKSGELFWTAIGNDVPRGVPAGDICLPGRYFSSWQSWAAEGLRYMSSGPEILTWEYRGARDYSCSGDNFMTSWYRWPVRLAVASDVGLAEVRVMDGHEMMRRFLPRGKKRFEAVLPLVHNQQHNLVLYVKDVAGRWAVSAELWDHNHGMEEFMCGDRNNQLFYGHSRRKDGTKFQNSRNMGITPTKGVWASSGNIDPAAMFQSDPILGGAVPGFDSAVGGQPYFTIVPSLRFKGGNVYAGRLHLKTDRLTTSVDFCSGMGVIDGKIPDECAATNVWDLMVPIQESPWLDGWLVRRYLNTRPDSYSVAVWTAEASFTARQDMELLKGQRPELGHFKASGATHIQVLVGGKVVLDRAITDPKGANWRGELKPGDYIALYGSKLGGIALYPRDENLWCSVSGRNCFLYFRHEGSLVRKGTTFHTSLIAVGAPFTLGKESADFARKFADTFGLDGTAAYQVKVVSGKLVSQDYFLRLNGAGVGSRVRIGKADLPAYLPIQVEGLNPRWSVGLYEIGRDRYRPVGMLRDAALAQVDPAEGDLDVYVGHPFVCDDGEVFLTYMEMGQKEAQLEVHNPTDRAIHVSVKAAPDFSRGRANSFTLDLAPGSSRIVKVTLR